LRQELIEQGETFVTETDTEVMLRMHERYGPECVREFSGMFAFAIWDEREQTCLLARGPLGVKPLYYYEHGGSLAFASESIRGFPWFSVARPAGMAQNRF